jgi:O-antigen/teichoic acid export membrane protein
MKQGNIKNNYIYNISYEIFRVIVPLITTPYISRIFGSEGIGTYTLANTYVQYFILFAGLGFSTYAARELAYVRDDEEQFRNTFWEIMLARIFCLAVAIAIYFCTFFVGDWKQDSSYKVCMIYLFAAVFDVSYYFRAIEQFKTIALRNVAVKAVSLVLIFILIRNSSQVWLYTLILAASEFLGQAVMVLSIDKEIFRRPKLEKKHYKKHFGASVSLFIPTLAIQIYTMLDKVMLGEICGESEAGYYENAQKMIRLAATVASAFVAVSVPRMSYYFAKGNTKELKNHFRKVFQFVSFLVFPMCFGLIGVAPGFSSWYYGEKFAGIERLVMIGAPLIISLGWSNILGNMILIATNNQKYYTISVYAGAGLNVLMNFLCIPGMGAMGATIASVLAEFSGMLLMFYFSNKKYSLGEGLKGASRYLAAALIMFGIIRLADLFLPYRIWGTCIEILIGVLSYIGVLAIFQDGLLKEFFNAAKEIKKRMIDRGGAR